MTTSDYLQSLQNDMATLKANVAEKGVEVDENDNFTTLAQKVADISGGGGNIDEYMNMNYTSYETSYFAKTCGRWLNMIKKLDVSGISANAYYLFMGFQGTEIVGLGEANITVNGGANYGLSYMFSDCSNLTTLDVAKLKITSNDMVAMFQNCSSLTNLDLSNYNNSKMRNLTNIFSGCSSLVTLNISSFDFAKVTGAANYRANDMVKNCSSLENLTFGTNLGKGFNVNANNMYAKLDLSTCTKLTHESLMDVINKIYDLAGNAKNSQNLVLGATNIAKLTEEEIAIATNKGWNVS